MAGHVTSGAEELKAFCVCARCAAGVDLDALEQELRL